MKTIQCRGSILNLAKPVVMAIINATPDSFYEASRFTDPDILCAQAEKMLNQGASILDVGGMSSRPGAMEISPQEETDRVAPIVEKIHACFPQALISVDTWRARVAESLLQAGAHLINDISGGMRDPDIYAVAARYNAAYIMMHMRGTPATMQQLTDYDDTMLELLQYFAKGIRRARAAGVKDIILDPGFGFAKKLQDNYLILRHLQSLQIFDLPVLAGISRKSMIQKVLQTDANGALNGTTALHMAALERGASILRVHDVSEAREVIQLYLQLTQNKV